MCEPEVSQNTAQLHDCSHFGRFYRNLLSNVKQSSSVIVQHIQNVKVKAKGKKSLIQISHK